MFVLIIATLFQATIGIDFLSKTMYLEDRTVGLLNYLLLYKIGRTRLWVILI